MPHVLVTRHALWRVRLLLAVALLPLGLHAAPPALSLDANQQRLLGIRSTVAAPAEHLLLQHLPATVEAAFDSSAVVTVPYAGTVTRVLKLEGAQVAAGTPLARVQSREVIALQAMRTRSASEAQLARSQAQREQLLFDEGIIAASRAQGSAARAAQAGTSLREAEAALKLAPGGADTLPGEYELRAPIAGRILQRHVSPGQSAEALAAAFLIGPGDSVDLSLRVPATTAAAIPRGTPVQVEGSAASCTITAGALAADASTQSVTLRAHCEQPANLLPGQQVQASLRPAAPAGAIQVPRTALVRLGQVAGVYVQRGDSYRHVAVDVLSTAGDTVIVHGALEPDALVVISGTSTLKSLDTAD